MPCPSCGEICRCPAAEDSSAPLRDIQETKILSPFTSPCGSQIEQAPIGNDSIQNDLPAQNLQNDPAQASDIPDDASAWRQELSARLNRYHSRRKPRPPRYPSLQLKFEQPSAFAAADVNLDFSRLPSVSNRIVSNQAVAFDEVSSFSTFVPEPAYSAAAFTLPDEATAEVPAPLSHPPGAGAGAGAKIIEFPRSWTPPVAPLDQLAGPVVTAPRILEVPEIAPPPPALGGITIEPPAPPPIEKRPGIDIPLLSAPLEHRIFAAVIDSVIIVSACTLFAFIFWKLTAIEPPPIQIAGVFAGLLASFWSAYQYLLVVYAGTTPGLLLARLELCRFNGTPAKRGLRRWRVLASFLSAASLGMGYLWVFLDEDSLCWHDRITHTYLAASTGNSRQSSPVFTA
ncbi:MAG TPA: RDD family protein [Candidatus Sulfotelmatobacter sp.]|jgi:hypothetical protein